MILWSMKVAVALSQDTVRAGSDRLAAAARRIRVPSQSVAIAVRLRSAINSFRHGQLGE